MNSPSIYLPQFSWPITWLLLSLIMIIRYLVLSGTFTIICQRFNLRPITAGLLQQKQIKRDIYWSLISSIIFALAGTLLIIVWREGSGQIYHEIGLYPLWYLPTSLMIYMIAHDTYFYWTHRLLHRYKFKACHSVHHESKIPTAWTSFAFHPIEAIIQAIILPALVMSVPIHWSMLVVFLVLMSLFGVMNHLGHEIYPPFLEKYLGLINATHHQHHHQKVNQNFGLYFNWWDKFMGTERGYQ